MPKKDSPSTITLASGLKLPMNRAARRRAKLSKEEVRNILAKELARQKKAEAKVNAVLSELKTS